MQTFSGEIRVNENSVIRQPVERDGLVGTLFHPATPGPHPAAILLGGSLGGMEEGSAAVLASAGYAGLALTYFGAEGLPPELVEIPLEYFAEAIAWLRARPVVDPDRVAVIGVSKGCELALLLGATYPEDIKAVVGYASGGIVWQGDANRPQAFFGSPRSSWTLGGEPFPFVTLKPRFSEVMGIFFGRVPSARAISDRSLNDEAAVAKASIAVEKINGPVLLISHTDDQMQDATRLSEMVIERLEAHNHPFRHEHLRYEGAGHPTGLPHSAPVVTKIGPAPLGGTLEANGFANADSWTKVLYFLGKHFKQEEKDANIR